MSNQGFPSQSPHRQIMQSPHRMLQTVPGLQPAAHLDLWAQITADSNVTTGGDWIVDWPNPPIPEWTSGFGGGSTDAITRLVSMEYQTAGYTGFASGGPLSLWETPWFPEYTLPDQASSLMDQRLITVLGLPGAIGKWSFAHSNGALFSLAKKIWDGSTMTAGLTSSVDDCPPPGISKAYMFWPGARWSPPNFGAWHPEGWILWQNITTAMRSRYRVDAAVPCFEAWCQLWLQYNARAVYSDPTVGDPIWTDGWPPAVPPEIPFGDLTGMIHGRFDQQARLVPRNFVFLRDVTPEIFTGGLGSTDTTSSFNYIGSSTSFESEILSSLDPSSGYVGNLMFQAFENKSVWQSRTGWTIA